MFRFGEVQELEVVKTVDFGVYLCEDRNEGDRVLLPRKQVPANTKAGDKIEVFLYKDSQDRPIATTNTPLITMGKVAVLKVKDVTRIGAFLDWGLEKDLMLPFKEQTEKLEKGDKVLVALYLDKSERLCATMKVHKYLSSRSGYVIGDETEAFVYEINPRYGAFVALDNKYSGLIQNKDIQSGIHVGDILTVRVVQVREDGRLTVTHRKKAYQQLAPDSEMVIERIKQYHGVLPFDDRVDPEIIKNEFGISKAAFKRAVGHLLKENCVEIKDGKIYAK